MKVVVDFHFHPTASIRHPEVRAKRLRRERDAIGRPAPCSLLVNFPSNLSANSNIAAGPWPFLGRSQGQTELLAAWVPSTSSI